MEELLQAVVDLDWVRGTPRLEINRNTRCNDVDRVGGPVERLLAVVSPDTWQKYVVPRNGGYNVPVPDADEQNWTIYHMSPAEFGRVVESLRGRPVSLDDLYRAVTEHGQAHHRYYESKAEIVVDLLTG